VGLNFLLESQACTRPNLYLFDGRFWSQCGHHHRDVWQWIGGGAFLSRDPKWEFDFLRVLGADKDEFLKLIQALITIFILNILVSGIEFAGLFPKRLSPITACWFLDLPMKPWMAAAG
jgi:hypothetical protein